MPINRNALFLAFDGRVTTAPASDGVFISDGTTAGATEAIPLATPYPTTFISATALTYNTVFSLGSSLYATDPTTGRPAAVPFAALASAPTGLIPLGAIALFSALDITGNTALWRTDGTATGTFELTPSGASANFNPRYFARVGNSVVFEGKNADGTLAVWSSNGTSDGTSRILQLNLGSYAQLQPVGDIGGQLVFSAGSIGGGSLVFITDGTSSGTSLLQKFGSSITSGAPISNNKALIFGTSGGVVYRTDGISVTSITSGPFPSVSEDVRSFVSTGSKVFYLDTNFGRIGGSFTNLAVTDGTSSGTTRVAVPLAPNASSFLPSVGFGNLTPFGNRLLFSADDTGSVKNPTGLWITDGTSIGTQQLAAQIAPSSIVVDGNRAFVIGRAGLYVTDGTAGGTELVSAQPMGTSGGLILDATRIAVTGTHTQYALSPTSNFGLQIADIVANRDGAATYSEARVVAFNDGSGILDPTGNAQAVARIYEAAYGRAPDVGGLIAYTEALDGGTISLLQVAVASATSPEFIADYGNQSDTSFVTQLFNNADGRTPDAGGLAGYTAALASGQSRGAVLLDIAESYEARQHASGVAGEANDATTYRLYQAVDARTPDSSGQQAYSAALASGRTVQQLATTFLSAPEYAQRFGAPDNATFVTELYNNLLGRMPDAGGLAAYTATLEAGTSRAAVVAAFVTGDEARLITSLATHDGWVFVK